MLKPGLGKGLGELMRGDQVAGKDRPSSDNGDKGLPMLGRGMKSLVQPEPEEAIEPKPPPVLPTWFYFSADVLLLAYTVGITFDAASPFDFGTVIFCAVSISAGAVLAIVGALQSSAGR